MVRAKRLHLARSTRFTEKRRVWGRECRTCGSELTSEKDEETFWAKIRRGATERPEYEAILRWSQGKCFPDFDTLENAYRQAMEGRS